MTSTPIKSFDTITNSAVIAPNNFKFKSLSDWSYNIAMGCRHGCSFCYVPSTATIKQETNLEKIPGLIPQQWIDERLAGKHWGDSHWGEFAFVRSWDEKDFRASLRSAVKAKNEGKLTPDGNAAVMLCTTTDPYQALGGPNAAILRELLKNVVRNALEIILEESDLNVRILTRSPAAERDFDLFRRFAAQDRILFGMSLSTFDPSLSEIYEPNAPRPEAKFHTLQRAVQEGIPVYVAMAPTLPDEGEAELRETIARIMSLNPVTLFHEPINLRAENLARIEAKAHSLGRSIRSDVFRSRERWREYAFEKFALVDKICDELGVPEGVLHQWPDEDLGSKNGFLEMKKAIAVREHGPEAFSKAAQDNAESEWVEHYKPWIDYWHNPSERISAWPSANPVLPANTSRPRLLSPTAAISYLSQEETLMLNELEKRVENSFLDTCRALCEIKNYKDGLFWKDRFSSFAEYVKERFNYQTQHAYRLAAAGEFVRQIESHNSSSTTKIPLPEKEIQVRHIINKIPEKQRLQCWQGLASKCSPSELTGVAIEAEVVEFRKKLPGEKVPTRKRKPQDRVRDIANASLRLIKNLRMLVLAHPNAKQILKQVQKIEQILGRDPTIRMDTI